MERTFIDLGLPSGRLWAARNEPDYLRFNEAVMTFGERLPSSDAFAELFEYCSRKWDWKRKGFLLTGPNGNTLFLNAAGSRYVGCGLDGCYWTSDAGVDGHDSKAISLLFNDAGFIPRLSSSRTHEFAIRLCKESK